MLPNKLFRVKCGPDRIRISDLGHNARRIYFVDPRELESLTFAMSMQRSNQTELWVHKINDSQ